jgi:predicted RNA-binding Zn-ribbon protein involved in translation (DUF1610 family)
VEIVLALATFVVFALALALAPGRWRRPRQHQAAAGWAGSPPASRAGSRPAARPTFLGVCGRCAEIVEGDASTHRCPACGAELVVRQRIVSRRRERSRATAGR